MVQARPLQEAGAEPVLDLGWEGERRFEVNANVVATGRTCVIGASGSGKSYAVGVICEELCKNGVPFAIIDTEGEHAGLKEKFEVGWVGDEPGSDLQWSTLDLGQLAAQAPDIAPLVLDVSETEAPKQKVGDFLAALYKEVDKRRTPYLVIVEEADRFIPQSGEKLAIFDEIARRGRKRGVGLMVCTQRPSLVDKNILSQCGNQLIGKLVIRNDLQAVAQFFSGHDLPKHLTTMEAGTFFAMGGLSPTAKRVKIRKKETHYKGGTPRLGSRTVKPLKSAMMAFLRRDAGPGARPSAGAVGVNPGFQQEDVPGIVKRDKSFVFFGKEEVVTSAHLVFRPMVELGVATKTGVLRRRVEVRYIILDGQTGMFVELDGAPVLHEGLRRLMGLDSGQIEALRAMRPDKDMSGLEIASRMGTSTEMLRRPIRALEERRLIRSFKLGKARVFRRIFDFPEFPWHDGEQSLEAIDASRGRVEESKLNEGMVREVIKGAIPYSDVQGYRQFLYPLYRVELVMKRRKRIVWLDGRTGREFHP